MAASSKASPHIPGPIVVRLFVRMGHAPIQIVSYVVKYWRGPRDCQLPSGAAMSCLPA